MRELSCHEEITEARKRINDAVGRMNTWELSQLEVFIKHRPILDVMIMLPGCENDNGVFSVSEEKWDRFLKIVKGAIDDGLTV
jgi:hypothetical protein